MTGPETAAEARLRQLFRDAAAGIGPTRPAPAPEARPPRPGRAGASRLVLGLAVGIVVAAVAAFGVHAWGGSAAPASGGGTGALLAIRSDGAVDLLAADTGAVLRTLVGPSAVDASGRHLGRPVAVTASATEGYIAFGRLNAVIERVPLAGGPLTYVTTGMAPSVSPDGAELAVFRLSTATKTGRVVVRDLATGSERTVDAMTGGTILDSLSWSSDDTQLALSGVFLNPNAGSLIDAISIGVQVLALTQPTSATNPHLVGTASSPANAVPTWTDAQFLGSADLGVLVSTRGACQAAATVVASVDPATGQQTTVVTFAGAVAHAVFDPAGHLVAYLRPQPVSCAPSVTTTSAPPGGLGRVGTSGGGSFTASSTQTVLYRWTDGTSRQLDDDVVAAVFVPPVA